ncbi:hypothetical protein ACBJ59_36230 [Nonomuraea sp. MTCD27]|uniref:hypothetical protein n=1 Tax=Nonomuraea sp. MTCD27 TaxID=1676747 RepID=UPI0035BF1B78
MTSPRSNEASSNGKSSYDTLIRKALRLLRRSSAREEVLTAQLARAFLERDRLQQQLIIAESDAHAQAEISKVMRSGSGEKLVVIQHDGMTIRAILHAPGRRAPAREAAVWRCLRDTAINARESHHER